MGVSSRRGGPSILLFLDYDGTLVSFKDTPLEAVLSPARKALLRRLAGKLRVCIVTGRSLAEIRRFVGLEELAYIGNHGLEMTWDGRAWVHPGALRLKPLVQDALRRIDARSAGWEGRLVENKGLTGSVHYRLLGPTLRKRMFRVVRREVEPAGRKLKIVAGAKVWEIRPGIDWDKGRGCLALRPRLGLEPGCLTIYLGDDRTDEDAFRALRGSALTFKVGETGPTQALGRVPTVDAVWEFLRALL